MVQFEARGLDEIIEALNRLGDFSHEVESRIEVPLKEFIQKIKDDQLSGRPGLNRITGTLYDSLEYSVVVAANSLEAIAGSDAEYIAYHEYGTSTIPKRLNIEDEWTEFVETDFLDTLKATAEDIIHDR